MTPDTKTSMSMRGLPKQLRRYIDRIHATASVPDGYLGFDLADVETSLSSRFQTVVERQPDALAVIGTDLRLTFRELSDATNAIASRLINRINVSSQPILLLAQQGIEVPVGMIGIHKSGNIVVPVDPNYPRERLRLVCESTRPAGIVCARDERSLAKSIAEGRCPIETIDMSLRSSRIPDIALQHRPNEPAFVYFTSGSTGKPKGVVRNHADRLHSAKCNCELYRLGPNDRWSALHSTGFSSVAQDVYFPLLSGAAHCPWNIAGRGFDGLDRWLDEIGLTILNWVQSAVLGMIDSSPSMTRLNSVRVLVLTSESLLVRQVKKMLPHFRDDCIFFNRLSSTEVGMYRLFGFDKQTEFSGNQIPVGYELPDAPLMLVDDYGNEVPRGETGELVIRSNYLATEYWQDPELTSHKFRDDPKGDFSKAFFSGDMGRLHDDDCLEFHGRKDLQVKIRGQRIEIAEIENALLSVEGIDDAAAVARTDESDDPTLIGFYVLADGVEIGSTEIRRQVGEHLPRYMIPSSFVRLNAIPRNPNNKVDYLSLANERVAAPGVSQAPANRLQKEIAGLWREVLQIQMVGANSDFYALGGDSLKAMQVVSRLQTMLEVELPITAVFDHPVLSDYALYLEQQYAESCRRLGWCERPQ